MPKNREKNDVRVGQVWESCDKREKGRQIIVERIEEGRAVCRRWGRGAIFGNATRIRLDRFKPISTGYRLVIR